MYGFIAMLLYIGHNPDQIWDDMNRIIVMVMLKFESSVYKATKEFADIRYHVMISSWYHHGIIMVLS